MINVFLLKPYNGHGVSEIVNVRNDIALDLIEQKVARSCTNRDFLIKPIFGKTKAFRKSPIRK
jgi:hypothetical protein